jgi:hypothetical protein
LQIVQAEDLRTAAVADRRAAAVGSEDAVEVGLERLELAPLSIFIATANGIPFVLTA